MKLISAKDITVDTGENAPEGVLMEHQNVFASKSAGTSLKKSAALMVGDTQVIANFTEQPVF